MRLWIINAVFSLLIGGIGAAIGWWVRGRVERSAANQHKRLVKDAMEGLQECTSNIRTRIAAHSCDVAKVADALRDLRTADGSEVASAVSVIVNASDHVRSQLAEIEQKLQMESTVIGRAVNENEPELLFFKSMDRKKRLYRKVLCSLELLANDLAADVDEHRSRVGEIGEALSTDENQDSANVIEAVSQIVNATSNMQDQISRVEKRLEAQTAQVEKHVILAGRDELTGLPNRRTFDKELRRVDEEFQSHKKPFSLIFLDVDQFKKVNDQYGHQVGDDALRELGKTLLTQIRDGDTATRYGGDEFAILLPHTTEYDARLVAERIRKAYAAKNFSTDGKQYNVTVSVGVSTAVAGLSPEAVVQRADQALYAAKEAGRNKTYWHDGTECVPFGKRKTDLPKPAVKKSDKAVREENLAEKGSQTQEAIDESVEIPPEFELSNRSIFCVNVNRRITEWQRGGPPISLLLLRIDQTNAIANQHGQLAVSQLRAALCRLLAAFSRDMDDRCEFDANTYAILVPDSDSKSIGKIGERLRAGVADSQMQFGNQQWKLTASVGVAHTGSDDSGMELMRRGELAVRAASDQGGNATYLADRSDVTRVTALASFK
ncbi:MAG: diguanylate cyclase [Planctomycetes bacterium]|nr:diguanylate cyclase [Planctomycetota bacterium]